ncbi:hypothetical protein [Microbacterium maritypicum]
MSHPDELLEASIRERRRIWVLFVILLFVFAGVLGTAWTLERARGDSWRDQALHWQDEYVSLYDEFTVSTGEEPQAPDPSDVAQDAPVAEQGEPGAPGPVGAAGRPGKDGQDGTAGKDVTADQIAAAVAAYCADGRCVGPAGQNGTNGTNGTNGAPGADSTVPGPAGATGPAGPTCPDGSTATTVWLSIADSQFGTFSRRQATVCLPTAPSEGGTP